MNISNVKPSEIIAIGGAFMGFVIGSAFASGQECLLFFTSQGVMGSLGAGLIGMLLYAWFGTVIIEDGRNLKLKSANDVFKFYCGKYIGTFFEWFTPFMLFLVFAIMIAAAGATFEEYYGINGNIGRIIMVIAALFTVLLGLKKLVHIIGYIAPLILIGTIIIGVLAILENPQGIANANVVMETIEVNKATSSWVFSGILYGAYTVVGIMPFLSGIGSSTATNRKNAIGGGLFGGISFLFAAMILNFGLLANIGDVYQLEIPSLFVATKINPIFATIFSVMLLFGIYTTAVPMLFTVCNKVSNNEKSTKYRIAAIITAIVGFFGGQLSFAKMVGILYPITGYMGLLIFACMLYSKYIKKINYEDFLRKNDNKTKSE